MSQILIHVYFIGLCESYSIYDVQYIFIGDAGNQGLISVTVECLAGLALID